MKDIQYYMGINYKIEILRDEAESGYVLSHPELKGCVTCASSIEQGISQLNDAKSEWIKAALEDKYEIPEPVSENDYSGQFKLRIPKSLHKELAEHSKREGISMNQYCLYLLSKNLGSTVKKESNKFSTGNTAVSYINESGEK
jgi:antitoxin HicB